MAKRVMKDPSGLSKKFLASLPVGFREEADAMGSGGLKKVIVEAEGTRDHNKRERAEDEHLAKARERVKDLGSGYAAVEKAQAAKIKYALHVLRERGEEIGNVGTGAFSPDEEDDDA
jgi:hypothetical protein